MRAVIKILLLPLLFLSVSILIHILAIRSISSSPMEFKKILREKNAYELIATTIEEKMAQSTEEKKGTPLHISPVLVQSVSEDFLDQIIAYASGRSSTPPSLSIKDILSKAGPSLDPKMVKELESYLKEMQDSSKDIGTTLPKEQQEALSFLNTAQKNGGIISFEKQFSVLKKLGSLIQIVFPISIGILFLSVLFIIILSTDAKSRIIWLSISSFFVGAGLFLGILFYSVPQLFISSISPTSEDKQSVIFAELIKAVLLPFTDIIIRYHIAVVVMCICLGVILFLARLMLFRSPEAPPTKKK